jgi:hypothetical protein
MKGKPLAPFVTDRGSWALEIEPYTRSYNESLADLRDNLRLKKFLRRAVRSEIAPMSLIDSIKANIRA